MQKDDHAEEAAPHEATERLALALEDAGFDVGQEFPDLHDAIGREGSGVVRIGDVTPLVADRLAGALYIGYVGAEEDNDT